MARLSKLQEKVRLQLLQLESLTLLPEEVGARILAAIQLVIPADESILFGVDPSSLLFNRVIASSGSLQNWMRWLQRVYLVKEMLPELTFPGLMQANLSAIAIHDWPQTSLGLPNPMLDKAMERLTPKDWHHSYHDIQTPVGGILRSCFTAKGQWIAGLELCRQESHSLFRPSDVGFIRLVSPLIGRLLQASYERERAIKTGTVGSNASGILVLGEENYREQFCNPAAEMWIKQLEASDAQRVSQFPTAMLAEIARLNSNQPKLGQSMQVWTPAGILQIEASRSERDGSIAIIFTPQRPPAPPDIPIHWPLTAQERQVVGLIFQGVSNAQMAAILVVSEHTIASHLSHIYEKLSVHSRKELLACLFREIYWAKIEPIESPEIC